MRACFFSFLFSVFFIACARGPSGNANSKINLQDAGTNGIINGIALTQNTAAATSAVALLLFPTANDFASGVSRGLCTGSLIGPHAVLTAAHCVEGIQKIMVVFKHDLISQPLTSEESSYVVEKIIRYPGYNYHLCLKQLDCPDLAVVEFSKAAPSSYKVAQFLPDNRILKPGASLYPLGFGVASLFEAAASPSAGTLRQGEVVLKNSLQDEPASMIFSQHQRKGICRGDSGGPVVYFDSNTRQIYLVGITSRTFKPSKQNVQSCDFESVATNVQKYKSWVQESLNSL